MAARGHLRFRALPGGEHTEVVGDAGREANPEGVEVPHLPPPVPCPIHLSQLAVPELYPS